jgi:pimeloyl-ACP methyl ester carboxylesterase
MDKLILLHGALGSQAQFDHLNKKLSVSFDVLDFNFAGHGGLPLPESFSIELFVHNTLSFMDERQIASANIFGYSMGGYVALQLAHAYPERVNRIVTLGTKFHWTPESAEKEVRMMNPDIIKNKIPAFAASLAERHHPENWKEIMTRTGKMMTLLGEGAALTQDHFTSIENDVLVCIGSQDHMVTIQESERTAHHLKNGRLKIIEGFKHPLEAIDQNVLADICTQYFNS